MTAYLNNVLMALLGKNPHAEEVKRRDEEIKSLKAKVISAENELTEATERLHIQNQRVNDFINLTENLRQRIDEKDDQLKELRRLLNSRN